MNTVAYFGKINKMPIAVGYSTDVGFERNPWRLIPASVYSWTLRAALTNEQRVQ